MKRAFFLVFSVLSLQSQAQYPGYMGKKFTFGYSVAVRPNFLSIIYGPNIKYAGPALTHSLGINIVHSQRREISLAARYMGMKVGNSYYGDANTSGIPAFEKYSQLEYSLGFKKFGKSQFAPLGLYSKWEIYYASGRLKYDAFQMEGYDPITGSEKLMNYEAGIVKFNGAGGSYSFGRQRVMNHKILFDLGMKVSLMILREGSGTTSYEERIASSVKYGLVELPLVNFYVGFGFLGF